MRVLVTCSWVTVVCALLVSLWTVPQLLAKGYIDVGGPGFASLYLFPGLIGVPVSLLAAAVSVALLVRGRVGSTPARLLVGGHLLTVVLIVLCVVALGLPSATGWELVLMPGAFQLGQIVVAVGLALLVRARRREG